MKYIDADLIEQHVHILHDEAKENLTKMDAEEYRQYWIGRQGAYSNVLTAIRAFRKQNSTLDSLQQDQPDKVDFEDVWKTYYDNHLFLRSPMPSKRDIARHFYELGLKARKL